MSNQKKKSPTEFLKLNVKVLNIRSSAKYKCLQSQKKTTKLSGLF